ncbi:ABC transporter, phosphonate, periplasmic substrate-binding protein [Polystyrenella longa]|uniref:ABC transporter, phosphonate, periplasmic substrate-binding protein n=1 Tax=Polystyrenella longa TaxID=2528007 RepID=A0A518CHI7_9PLAN|nr:PhnD/SsuA/transferrin family substrate-binding protein [Polystyrenella longa]QDU78634.1 ABC transporter, phosphonate, periplasmic substrate-binding protein [Polystyrenella longa]
MQRLLNAGLVLCGLMFLLPLHSSAAETEKQPLNLIVMDPLAAPLACDCVKGYAQRKYEKLAEHLETELDRPVNVSWGASLEIALKEKTVAGADLIIGKDSVVRYDSAKAKIDVQPVACLAGKDGGVTQSGLIVVRAKDAAQSVGDLKGYRLFFGPKENEEKYAAPMKLLQAANVTLPEKIETYPACSDAATALLELDKDIQAAAVISSYAEPLLEGCGSVKKGDLRVVGESESVPFVTAFVNQELSTAEQDQIKQALFDMIDHPELLRSLETSIGFLEIEEQQAVLGSSKKKE